MENQKMNSSCHRMKKMLDLRNLLSLKIYRKGKLFRKNFQESFPKIIFLSNIIIVTLHSKPIINDEDFL